MLKQKKNYKKQLAVPGSILPGHLKVQIISILHPPFDPQSHKHTDFWNLQSITKGYSRRPSDSVIITLRAFFQIIAFFIKYKSTAIRQLGPQEASEAI